MHKTLQASGLVAISGILYGFLGYFGTIIVREDISISTMLFWRFLIAGSWIMLFVIKKHAKQPILHAADKRTLLFMFFLGAIGYAGASEFYFIASQYTGTGLAMVLFFSYPIIIALVSWIVHKQNFTIGTVLVLICMVMGLFLLRDSSSHPVNVFGIFVGIVAAGCYAFYMIGSKRVSAIAIDSNVLTTVVCFGCAFIFLIISVLSHRFVVPHSIKSWLYLLALGILITAVPIQLMLEGLKVVSSMRASIISVLEPLVTVLVGVLLLNDSVSHVQMVGAFIILGSALLVQFQRGL